MFLFSTYVVLYRMPLRGGGAVVLTMYQIYQDHIKSVDSRKEENKRNYRRRRYVRHWVCLRRKTLTEKNRLDVATLLLNDLNLFPATLAELFN